jgi:hypothetical protein
MAMAAKVFEDRKHPVNGASNGSMMMAAANARSLTGTTRDGRRYGTRCGRTAISGKCN